MPRKKQRIITDGVEHDPSDPKDFARQWFYKALNDYAAKAGTNVFVVKEPYAIAGENGGNLPAVDWAFLDHFLPERLNELLRRRNQK